VREVLGLIEQLTALASGLSFFLGFATPSLLRRAWQEPELRAFLGRAASLPRLPDTASIVRALERGAEEAVGAPRATIGLWDADAAHLVYEGRDGRLTYAAGQLIAGRAFTSQRAIFSENAPRDDPQHAAIYRARGANAILAAPITAGGKRLGVLSVFAPRAPIFAEEDLRLVQLLADQGAVILESRALIDEAARVQAREEATRLKDDFLSAAAHDLKTPLTALIATAQLMERRVLRQPERPPDLDAIRRIVGESIRLRTIVVELLDAARVEQRRLLGTRETVDLAELAREVATHHASEEHQVVVEAPGPVVGRYDRARIAQLVENLVENAVKYSPAGGEVRVAVWAEGEAAHLTVTDHGIGIPAADLPHLFERFHRGANVNDRQFAGMGLGLYICRGIVEEHGGRIEISSTLGEGSTFRVSLPGQSAGDEVAQQGEIGERVESEQRV
jgi:signal transduction histidine kinase